MSNSVPSDSDAPSESAVPTHTEKKRKVLPIHPLLFAAFPLLALLAANVTKIPLGQISWPLTMALLAAAIGWLFFLLVSRRDWRAACATTILVVLYAVHDPVVHALPKERQGAVLPIALPALLALFALLAGTQRPRYEARIVRKAAIAASIAVLLFFSVGHIVQLLPMGLQGLVLPACLLALVASLIVLARARQPLYDATSVLNLAACVLLIPSCWTILTQISANTTWSAKETHVKHSDIVDVSQSTVTIDRHLPTTPQDVPDVYYIILDAYGRADRLQTYYGYDNTPFLKALEARGFFIASKSEANYNQTPLCLASALSMNYLDPPRGQQLSPEILRRKVDDNAVVAYLRKRNYHYIDVASGMEESRVMTADVVLNDEPDLSTLEGNMLDLSAYGGMAAHQKRRFDRHRKRLIGGFTGLEKAAALPYPKFVFAHILAPHPPFVFGPNGEDISPKGVFNLADASELLKTMKKDQYRRSYIEQLQYVNKRTLEAVDAILKQSKHRPIIIIQGDHGSRMNLDWESLDRTDLREPFSNLNAYLVPDNVRRDLTDKITAVNSFRIILTDAFGAKDLPRIPDRNFYSTESHPYDFIDVTERLAGMADASRVKSYAGHPARKSGGKGEPPQHETPPDHTKRQAVI